MSLFKILIALICIAHTLALCVGTDVNFILTIFPMCRMNKWMGKRPIRFRADDGTSTQTFLKVLTLQCWSFFCSVSFCRLSCALAILQSYELTGLTCLVGYSSFVPLKFDCCKFIARVLDVFWFFRHLIYMLTLTSPLILLLSIYGYYTFVFLSASHLLCGQLTVIQLLRFKPCDAYLILTEFHQTV